jgi:hypothetical protein
MLQRNAVRKYWLWNASENGVLVEPTRLCGFSFYVHYFCDRERLSSLLVLVWNVDAFHRCLL